MICSHGSLPHPACQSPEAVLNWVSKPPLHNAQQLFLKRKNLFFFFFLLFLCHGSTLFHFLLGHCLTPKKEGPCRGSFPRWHYNAASSKCERFFFGGCKENSNNYLSEKECLNACNNTKGNANIIVLWQCCNTGLKEHNRNKGNKYFLYVPNQYAAFFFSFHEPPKENFKQSSLGDLLHNDR